MRFLAALCVVCLLVGVSVGQVVPPINLEAELLQAGEVALTWDAPPDGLVEDFEDGLAQDFEFYPDPNDFIVQDGYLKMLTSSAWQCAWYTGMQFTDFDMEATFQNVASNNSRGIQFRADGPRDTDYNGYNFYVALTSGNYSIYKFVNGSSSTPISWTTSPYVNTGQGETNTLRVVGSGNSFDLYINGNYVDSFTDDDHPSGMVSCIASSAATVWYDEITCIPAATLVPASMHPQETVPSIECDEQGQPLDGRIVDLIQPRIPVTPVSREIDEFIEYRIYRDNVQIGTSTTESYTDNLPSIGEYTYTVTAYYDEGESSHSNEAVVNWQLVFLDLTGQITQIPPEGGTVFYDAHVWNTTAQTFQNVRYWTMVELPNSQVFGPLTMVNVNITGFMNTTVQGLTQDIPVYAPEGTYTLTGHLGFYPVSYLSDSFEFEKLGTGVDAVDFNPSDWSGSALTLASDDEAAVSLPSAYALSAAYPNPFNPSTSFSVSLPESAELTVTVYNIAGQRVATLADGMTSAGQHEYTFDAHGLASGLYFVQAVVPGQLNVIRKITLLR